MHFNVLPLAGLFTISLNKIEDERGLFARTYCKDEFKQIGFQKEFVQFNHSYNKKKGTVRGMHFQQKPFTETKLIRCVQGSVYDVAVDLRKNSDTFLQAFGVELSAKNMLSILIPEGFAHGFQTLEDDTSLIYHHSAFYTPGADAGLRFNDPALKINWKLPAVHVSSKDNSFALINTNFKGLDI